MISKIVFSICISITIAIPAFSQTENFIPPPSAPDTEGIKPPQKLPSIDSVPPLLIPSGVDQDTIDPDLEITVGKINFTGNNVLSDEEIEAALSQFIGRVMKVRELPEIENKISELYELNQYLGSGAFIYDDSQPFNINNATIKLQIVERKITSITVDGVSKESKRLKPYVQKSLKNLINKPYNEKSLTNELLFLLSKPSIESIKLNIETTEFIEEASLSLEVEADDIFTGVAVLNDKRSPTTGSIEGGISLINYNLFGAGDEALIDYRKTEGSNLVALSYQIPVNSSDGKVSLNYLLSDSFVSQEPLDQLDLRSISHTIGVSFEQPILRSSSNQHLRELSMGFGISRYDNQDLIDNIQFPLSDSADINGKTRSLVLNAFQEFTSQTESDFVRVLSNFSYGIPAFTTNDDSFGNGEFFKFSIDSEYTHKFSNLISSTTRLKGQITDRDVILSENFFLGGSSSVRGLRPAAIDLNNGMTISQEIPFTIFASKHKLQVVPFFDFGIASNRSNQISDQTQTAASTGFIIRYGLLERLSASFEFAQPLFGDRDARGSQINFDFQWRIW